MKEFRYRFRVKFDNVDYARVLYFPRQIDIYIEALEEFCRSQLGLAFRKMLDADRIAWPTVHLEVDYRAPLQYEEEAEIKVSVLAMGEKSITFGYEVYRLPDQTMTSKAVQKVAIVDFDSWKSIPVPPHYHDILKPWIALASK